MESMPDPINQNVNNHFLPSMNTTEESSHPQSTFETFTATPSTFRRASASPPATVPFASAQFLATEINRPSSAVDGSVGMAPVPAPNPLQVRRNNEQREVTRLRILAKVTEKYPGKPIEFRNRKVAKQMAIIFPESTTSATNGSIAMGSNTPNTSTPTSLPQDSIDGKPVSHNEAAAMNMDDEEERSFQTRKQIPSSTNDSTPREASQMQEFPFASRSAIQLPPTSANGTETNGDVSMDDDAAEVNSSQEIQPPRRRSPQMTGLKLKGIVMGYYRLSDVANNADKHAVFGKIDKGGDLFTTVSKETRGGRPVPSQQYLASKVQCSPEKICFEPHLDGLNKQQLKQYVMRRLDADWASETEQSRRASELQIASEVRNDKSLNGQNPYSEPKKQPTVMTGMKRGYQAFADENEDDDEDEDESPLSEINETTFPDTDDEDAFIPAGSSKKRRPGRKSIGARTSKGDTKETDGDDIANGVLIGVWKESPAEALEDKHAVYSYLDSRGSLWSRVYHVTKDGRHIDQPIPFPRGTVKWDDIILDEHLNQMDRDEVKEYVVGVRKRMNKAPADDMIKKDRKPRKSYSERDVKQEQPNVFRSKTSAVLLGYWKLSLEEHEADKNAVYGYVDTSGRFNLQVRKHTRDGREITRVNPDFPGNGRVQKENMVLEDHLKHLSHAQVQAYTRRALSEGVADLTGNELREAEFRIAAEVASEEPSEIALERPIEEPPRVKRKYTRRSIVPPHPAEAHDDGVVDEASTMRPISRPQSRSMMFDQSGSMGNPPPQGFMQAQSPYGFQPNGIPGVSFGPNGSLIFNGIEYHPSSSAQPPVIDESGTTITNNGLQYVKKVTGAFKGKFVHTNRQLISVNGDDYAEYRVLVQTDI